MGVTNYHTINGRIVGQTKNGVRTHYVPDALGSVVATLDANGTVENTYRYKPYGNLLAKTGTGDDPRFMWVGSLGYLLGSGPLVYVRYRAYLPAVGTWSSADPLWPIILDLYSYVAGNPATITDQSGLLPQGSWPGFEPNCKGLPPKVVSDIDDCMNKLCKALSNPWVLVAIKQCLGDLYNAQTFICLATFCSKGKPIYCDTLCSTIYWTDCKCKNGSTFRFLAPEYGYTNCNNNNQPDSQINLCTWWFTNYPSECVEDPSTRPHHGSWAPTVIHELIHMCGKCKPDSEPHGGIYNPPAECIAKVLGCQPYPR